MVPAISATRRAVGNRQGAFPQQVRGMGADEMHAQYPAAAGLGYDAGLPGQVSP